MGNRIESLSQLDALLRRALALDMDEVRRELQAERLAEHAAQPAAEFPAMDSPNGSDSVDSTISLASGRHTLSRPQR